MEPAQVKSTLCRALPAVYQRTTKVAMLNLGPKITVKAGTTIAEATPMVLQSLQQTKETVKTTQDGDANGDAKQLWEGLRLEENPILKEKPDLLQEVKDLIWEYRDVF